MFIYPQPALSSRGRCALLLFVLKWQSAAETNTCNSNNNDDDNNDYSGRRHNLSLISGYCPFSLVGISLFRTLKYISDIEYIGGGISVAERGLLSKSPAELGSREWGLSRRRC